MTRLASWLRFMLGAIALAGVIALSAPAQAQQAPIIDPDASVVNEQTLLRELARIQGDIDQLDPRARVLIQPAGRVWDHFHEVTLYWGGAIVILGTLAALAAAYLLLGRIRISAGRSGRKVLRFKAVERFGHWLAAVSFVILGITGLDITFGKHLLLPLIGHDAFSVVSEVAQVVHAVIAVLFVALILGHIYIGTLGMEGAFEAMWTGEVDYNWAKEHHDLWLEDLLAKDRTASAGQSPLATPAE